MLIEKMIVWLRNNIPRCRISVPLSYQGLTNKILITAFLTFSSILEGKVSVFVSIPPQAYFVKRIGGDHITVTTLLAPGASPATYAPAPTQIQALSQADLYFRIGVPFESRILEHIQRHFPETSIIDTREGIPLREMTEPHSHAHICKGAHAVHEDGKDPHIWLDPRLVKTQAIIISNALTQQAPEHSAAFAENLSHFQDELDALDQEDRKSVV